MVDCAADGNALGYVMDGDLSRRQFFRIGPRKVLERAVTQGKGPDVESVMRPPGAQRDEALFLDRCSRCAKCVEACPFDVIESLGPEHGLSEGTPAMHPDVSPCRWCPTMDCVTSCTTAALELDAAGQMGAIGKAVLKVEQCLNSEGILCDDCVRVCPSHLKAITLVGRMPKLDLDRCTGCGLCAHACSAEPKALSIRPL